MKKTITLICICAFFWGCEEEVPLDKLDPYSEKLVVNEYFSNNAPFSIQISGSKDAYKEPNPVVLGAADVTVTLTENGNNIPLTYDNFDHTFSSSILPQSGRTYNLNVSSGHYKSVSATGKLPANIPGKTSQLTIDGGIDMEGNTSDLLQLTFTDDGASKDYYKVNFFYYSELVEQFNAFDFELSDILKAVNTIKTRDGGFLFSDESFNGKQKTLTAVPPAGLVQANTTYKYLIKIERLSDEYWKYNTSLEQYRGGLTSGGNTSNIFKGAVVVYSNVVNGLGIFAGGNVQADTLK